MIEALMILAQVFAAALGAYGAVSIKLAWLRRDVDHAHRRIEKVDDRLRIIETQRGK